MTKKMTLKMLEKLKSLFEEDSKIQSALDQVLEKVEELSPKLFDSKKSSNESDYALPEEIKNKAGAFALFTDGACRGNPGPGAWASIGQNSKGEVLFRSSGLEISTTNNRMELEAVIYGLEHIGGLEEHFQKIYVYSDSKYVVEGMQKWLEGWKKRGWKKADNKPPENLELWKKLDDTKSEFEQVEFRWVKGHAGHPQNEACDRLANEVLDEAGF